MIDPEENPSADPPEDEGYDLLHHDDEEDMEVSEVKASPVETEDESKQAFSKPTAILETDQAIGALNVDRATAALRGLSSLYGVTRHAPCLKCGFDLHSLNASGNCPECGKLIYESLQSDQLQFADRRWLVSLTHGTLLLIITIIGSVIWSITAGFYVDPRIDELVALGFSVSTLIAVWLVTKPEPQREDVQPVLPRQIARWGFLAGFAVGWLALGAAFLPTGGRASVIFVALLSIASGLATIVGVFGLFVYAARLALRMPDLELAHATRTVMFGLMASYGIQIATVLTLLFSVSTTPATSSSVFNLSMCCGCGSALLLVGFWIWGLVVLVQYHNRLTALARSAAD